MLYLNYFWLTTVLTGIYKEIFLDLDIHFGYFKLYYNIQNNTFKSVNVRKKLQGGQFHMFYKII